MSVFERFRNDRGDARAGAAIAACLLATTAILLLLKTQKGEGSQKVCPGDVVVFDRSDGKKLVVGAPVVREAVSVDENTPVYTNYNLLEMPLYDGDDVGEGRWYDTTGERTSGPQTCEPVDTDHVPRYGETAIVVKVLPNGTPEEGVAREMALQLAEATRTP